VRRHAKAPSAGSTEGTGDSRGLLRRALAIRGVSSDSKGSGARSLRSRKAGLVTAIAVLASLLLVSSAAAAEPPVITIDHSPVFSYDRADVSGTIISGKAPVFYRFEYSTDPDTEGWHSGLGGRAVPPGATPQTVSDHLAGLKGGTHYEVRLVVEDIEFQGQYFSPEPNPSFTTLPVAYPTILATDDASSVSYTSAHLSGSVERPAGDDPAFDTFCYFEYVTDAQFDAEGFPVVSGPRPECAPQPITEVGPTAVSSDLHGLQAGTTYHIRLVVQNAGGMVTREAEHTFTTLAVAPPALTIDPVTDRTGFSAHVSGTVNPQAPSNDSVFDVNWHFECMPSCETHGGGTFPADASPHPVARTVTGLEPNTTYQITLVASNAGGPTTAGPVTVTTPKVAPGAQTLFAGAIQPTSATLAAKINPLNSPATYQFEWGTGSGYGNVVPAAPVSLGASDNSLHFVTTPLAGLQEATTYHFRIAATNTETGETGHGVDHTFTTLAVAGPPAPCPNEQRRVETNSVNLSDCRGYELVMPAVKDFPFGQSQKYIAVAAPSGNAVAYNTFGPLPGSEGGTQDNYAVARRGDSGWVTTSISPRQDPLPGEGTSVGFQGFSSDLSTAILGAEEPPLTPDATPGVRNLYLRNTETGAYTLLTTRPGTHGQSPFIGFAGASTDLTHVVFGSPDPLTDGLPGGPTGLFEWANGQLRYVGVLPDGTSAKRSAVFGRYTHVVSDDGRRIVFGDVDSGQIYDRIDGTSTLEVSASQRLTPDPNGPQRAKFWGATADGGTVYITSAEALTDDATTGVDGAGNLTDGGNDLYAYDVGSETLTDLSVDTSPADLATGANVQGVVGNSEDGQYVYFVALGDLGGGAVSGVPNLYLRHGDEVTYIGALDPNDKQVWDLQQFSPEGVLGVTSRVTPDGRNVLFPSIASLTGYDNVNPSTGAPTSQVYRYSADADTLSCVSCRPDGTPPGGDSTIPPPNFATSTPRNISEDGSRVFFTSTDAILPGDSNDKSDVYEWRGGTVHLVSDGSGHFDSTFYDASGDGKDVIFATGERLVGQDTDSHVDLYDARAGGGFPAPPAPLPQCEGEACRTGTSTVPPAVAAGTVGFSAPPSRPKSPKPTKASARAKALRACKAKPSKAKRKKCESQVKKRFANKKRSANKSGRGK
jgi:hypothetical protein